MASASMMTANMLEAELARRTTLVSRISWGLAGIVGAYLLLGSLLTRISTTLLIIELLTAAFFALLGWAAAGRRSRFVGELLIGATLLHALIASINAGGVLGPGPVIFFVVFALAGMVLRPAANLVFGGLSVAALLLLALLTTRGLIVSAGTIAEVDQPAQVVVAYTLVYGLLIVVVCVIAFLTSRSHEQALARLADQADAVAARNVQLLEQGATVRRQAAELERHRDRLEHEVRARTAELETALAELQRNAVALRELQTPLVPILDGVLIVPLVGAFDSDRAAQFVQDLLRGIEQQRAHTILLDLTGLPVMDTLAAQTLLHCSAAARLLGASVVLVGVGPTVAQTIVGLGLDLHALRFARDLQSAIAEA